MYLQIRIAKNIVLKKSHQQNPSLSQEDHNAIKERYGLKNLVIETIKNHDSFGFHAGAPVFPIETFKNDFEALNITEDDLKLNIILEPDTLKAYSSWDDYTIDLKTHHSSKSSSEKKIAKSAASLQNQKNQKKSLFKKIGSIFKKDTDFLIFDIEMYEKNHDKITEIGWVHARNSQIIANEHIIISENKDLLNGEYVPDHKFEFCHGESKVMSLNEAVSTLINVIHEHNISTFMGHSIALDFKYLYNNESIDSNLKKTLKSIRYADRNSLIDSSILSAGLDGGKNRLSISKTLDFLSLPYEKLHNAGNDAFQNFQLIHGLYQHNLKKQKSKMTP